MTEVLDEQPKYRGEEHESPIWMYALLGLLIVLVLAGIFVNAGEHTQANKGWLIVLGVIATLGIFTILYRENPLFRFMEHIFIGLATGYGAVYIWVNFVEPRWLVPMMPSSLVHETIFHGAGQGKWWLIFALLFGLLFFTVYVPKLAWMNRFAIGALMGWFAGLAFAAFMGLLGPQLVAAFRAPVTRYPLANMPAGPNNFELWGLWWHPFTLISIVVLFCVMAYFFFSMEHRYKWIRHPAVAGRYLLMLALGAIFGTTVMGRFSLLISRLEYLLASFTGWWESLLAWLSPRM